MEAITSEAQTPYQLLGSQKLVHLVRHAQGLHNLEAEKGRDAQKKIEFIDPELSSNGWQQVVDQRENVSASGMLGRIEVVITSPMLRTLQTAVGIFGCEDSSSSKETTLVEKINNQFTNSISIFNQRPPIIAHELCRERMRKVRKRATLSQCRSRFPTVDFSLIESEDDVSWETDAGETNDAVAVRGIEFIKWLSGRKEKEIALVSHGVFLQETMIALKNKCIPLVEPECDPYSRFGNCEIRSIIIFDTSVMSLGSDSSPRKQCGRIPYSLQLRTDSANNKNVSMDEVAN